MERCELEKKCIEMKNKYIDQVVLEGVTKQREMQRSIYETRRILGDNEFTDEEIAVMVEKDCPINDKVYSDVSKAYEYKDLWLHNPEYYGTNIKEKCVEISSASEEILMFLMFDKDNNFIGKISRKSGSEGDISADIAKDLCIQLLGVKECKYVISVHNHPMVAVATPSFSDGVSAISLKQALSFFKIELIDDCVITEVDFFSRLEAEKRDDMRGVYRNMLTKETRTELKKDNFMLYNALQNSGNI